MVKVRETHLERVVFYHCTPVVVRLSLVRIRAFPVINDLFHPFHKCNSFFLPFFSESDYNLTDKETTCPLWAKAGWCQSNEDLLDKCPHSCQKYGVQGANSLDERYITVNFQNSSSVASSKVVTFEAPPPPSAAIRSHSDLDTVRRITALVSPFQNSKKDTNNLEKFLLIFLVSIGTIRELN